MIVFVIRETGWTLEYIRQIPYKQLMTLVNELAYQKEVELYNRNYYLGVIAAILTSDKTHRRKAEDFVGRPPKRRVDICKMAKKAGIEIPNSQEQSL